MYSRKQTAKLIIITALCTIAFITTAAASPIYIIPDEAKCTVRKQDKITYCTDKQGNPITGELHRYKDNSLSRLYPLQNGILEGNVLLYRSNGKLKSEKPYKKGILNGIVKEYYPNGALESETPYVNGIKEGVAKSYTENGKMFSQMIYADDELNGEMRIYTPDGKTLYSFENEDNRLISGTYYYITQNNSIDIAAIPPIVIEALNNACLELQTQMTTSACAAIFNASSNICDEKWRRDNRKEVRKYLADCAKGEVD